MIVQEAQDVTKTVNMTPVRELLQVGLASGCGVSDLRVLSFASSLQCDREQAT